MKRIYAVGLSLCSALLLTTVVLFSYQQQAAAQVGVDPEAEEEIVSITPLRLDGQIVLSVTVRVGEDLTVTTPITLDVASLVEDVDGSTSITAAVALGAVDATVSAGVTETLTTTVDVTVTGVVTPLLSLIVPEEEEVDEEDAEEEDVLRGEVLFAANLRAEPNTESQIVGNAQPGTIVVIVDTNAAGDWYNLEGGEWIAGFLVQLIDPEDADADADADAVGDDTDAGDTDADDTDVDDAGADDADDDGADADDDADIAPPLATPTPTPEPEAALPAVPSTSGASSLGENLLAGTTSQYRVAVITNLLNLISGIEAIGNLANDPQMLSASWNENVKRQADVVRGSYQQISRLSPPDGATAFHGDLLSALGDCDSGMASLTSGLDTMDMGALDQAVAMMMQCGTKMEAMFGTYAEFLE